MPGDLRGQPADQQETTRQDVANVLLYLMQIADKLDVCMHAEALKKDSTHCRQITNSECMILIRYFRLMTVVLKACI